MKRIALIMAGGKGERLWPLSRPDKPKQFLSVTNDEKTLLQLAVERILLLVDISEVFIVTGQDFVKIIKEQLPELPSENIIVEPCGRNTAPAILLSAFMIQHRYSGEDVTMMVFPADHLIENTAGFVYTLNQACLCAQAGYLVTVGIKPSYPETGYGYLKICNSDENGWYPIEAFVEKPDAKTAVQYCNAGNYYWNAGIFIWNISTILHEFQKYATDLFDNMERAAKANFSNFASQFNEMQSISIDYAVLEKSQKVYGVLASFDWDDVGSFASFPRHNKKDAAGNTIISSCSKLSVLCAQDDLIKIDNPHRKEIVIIGISDCTLIDTEDVLLLCANNQISNIKTHLKGKSN